MRVSRLNDAGPWLEMVEAIPHTHFFQRPEWARVLCTHFRTYAPHHHMFLFDSQARFILPLVRQRICGNLVNALYSLPLGTFGGLIGETAPTADQLNEIGAYLRHERAVKVAIHLPPSRQGAIMPGFTKVPLHTQVMMLDRPYERLEREKFVKSKRESVGRARRRGVEIRNSKDSVCVEAFLAVKRLAQQDKGWRMHYPDAFVREILTFPHTRLFTAWQAGQCASGIIAFAFHREATAWLGAMDHSLKEGQPMNLLKAEMMRFYLGEGCLRLDLGASMGIESLETYKRAFGCDEVDQPVYEWKTELYALYARLRYGATLISR
jgi:CelD/BcsL family acetyltransferase involved in cellulose biosynthesis